MEKKSPKLMNTIMLLLLLLLLFFFFFFSGCNRPLGVESGKIEDTEMQTSFPQGREPQNARLNAKGTSVQMNSRHNEWIGVDLLNVSTVTG